MEKETIHTSIQVQEVLDEIKREKELQEKLIKRYKNCCSSLYYAQWFLNLISMSCYSTSLVCITTAIGIPVTISMSGIGVATNVASIFCNQLNKKKIKKLRRHSEILTLCRNFEIKLRHMMHENKHIDITSVVKMYYEQKDKHCEDFIKDIEQLDAFNN